MVIGLAEIKDLILWVQSQAMPAIFQTIAKKSTSYPPENIGIIPCP